MTVPEGDPTLEFAMQQPDDDAANPFAVVIGAVFVLLLGLALVFGMSFFVHLVVILALEGWHVL